MSLLVAAIATTAFAQNPTALKELKKTKDYASAKAIYDQNVSSFTDKEKGEAVDKLFDLANEECKTTKAALLESKTEGVDYNALTNAITMAYEGKKLASKKSADNVTEISGFRGAMINAANSTDNNDDKLRYSLTYINTAEANDQNLPLAAFFASYALYQQKDYPSAVKYSKQALDNETVGELAQNVYRASVLATMKTREDSIKAAQEFTSTNPDKYFVDIVNIYQGVGDEAAADKLVADALAKNPNNKYAYFFIGSKNFEKKSYDVAIENFKKAAEIDPSFTHAWFYMGACYGNQANELQDQVYDKKVPNTAETQEKIKGYINEGIKNYEKVRELDPNHEQVSNWPMQLRMLYNAIGEKEKADEISKMLGDM